MTSPAEARDALYTWRLWRGGLCPCCGDDLVLWEWDGTVYEPEAVAEEVILCGRCIGNEHYRPDELEYVLGLLALGANVARRAAHDVPPIRASSAARPTGGARPTPIAHAPAHASRGPWPAA